MCCLPDSVEMGQFVFCLYLHPQSTVSFFMPAILVLIHGQAKARANTQKSDSNLEHKTLCGQLPVLIAISCEGEEACRSDVKMTNSSV